MPRATAVVVTQPKVYVIIPNKNGINHLVYSLPSLMRTSYSNINRILVDNNSNDGSINFIRNKFKLIKILENKESEGFASTVNMGIKYALEQNADYIAVYNSDIKVLPKWLDAAIDIFSANGNIGLIGYTEIPKGKESLFYELDNIKVEYKEVKGLSGCLFICPSQVFKHIGLLDEEYFMYGEDNDFFTRLLKAGYLILQTNIPVWHYGEGSSGQRELLTSWLAYRNALRFSIKNESIAEMVRTLLALIYHGCIPFYSIKNINNPSLRRIKRYNIIVKLIFILSSILWNLMHIIPTMRARIESRKVIKRGLRLG